MILVKIVMISILNDKFRKSGFGTALTNGAASVPDLPGLLQAVKDYDDFTEDNDPYGEHDFGSLIWKGHKICWKIDYYDKSLHYWADPLTKECTRLMTVMLAEEY